MGFLVRRLLALLLCSTVVSSFTIGNYKATASTTVMATTKTRLAAGNDGSEQDHWMPEDVRVKRSKKIRQKLLGDQEPRFVPEGECPLLVATQQQSAGTTTKTKKKKDGDSHHAVLSQMTKLFEQHLAEAEAVDPNC